MKAVKPLLEVVAIFSISLIVLSAYSLMEYQIDFSIQIKKTPLKALVTPPPSEPFLAETYQQFFEEKLEASLRAADSAAQQIDTSAHTILLTGDSMCEELMFRFRDYAAFNGHKLETVIWYSSSTLWWSESDSLRKLIAKYDPDYIFFTTGSNELFIRNIQEREKYIQNIVAQAGNRKFIWIGPPNWAKDTGINELIKKNVGKDRFFESRNLTFERKGDGAHPTRRSSAVWADSISVWLMEKSRNKILLKIPES